MAVEPDPSNYFTNGGIIMNQELSIEEQFLIRLIRLVPDSKSIIETHLKSPWQQQEQLSSEDRMQIETSL